MYILHCDETNLEKRDGDFFVYAGIAISSEYSLQLHRAIDDVRRIYAFPADLMLKFNPRPNHLDHAQFASLKQSVIEAAIAANCVIFSTFLLHNIAASSDEARRNAINVLSFNFNSYLACRHDHGFVFIDRFSDNQIDAHLREKFLVGVTGLPYTTRLRLRNIVGFHYAAIGQSHYGSVIDVVLGTLRFCVNAFTRNEEGQLERADFLLQMLAPLFEKTNRADDHGPWVTELSLDFSPKTIKSDRFRGKYEALRDFLSKNGIRAAQAIR